MHDFAHGSDSDKERVKMDQVKECMMVTMEFKTKTVSANGEVSELPHQTCRFVYGVDTQYPSVETALQNKRPGDRVQVYVPPEELFGHYDDDLVRELPREDYKQERLREGCMYREMKKKCLVQFMVKEVRDDVVVADFNDPKCGTHAEFEILIKDVREATKEEMKPSCARGPEIMSES
jgi:FKBP-type peptidyl-prolyl cis-trans isomerase SlyD